MRDLAEVANLLRDVWAARRRFLQMAAVERAMIDPMIDRVADDLESVAAAGPDVVSPHRRADDEEAG
jgi:hypothetical protein